MSALLIAVRVSAPRHELIREVRRAPNGRAALTIIFRYMFMVYERVAPEELIELLGQAVDEEGKRKGLARGQLEGQRKLLLKQLRARFGDLPEVAVARVNAADNAQLDLWAERVLSAPTLADVLKSP